MHLKVQRIKMNAECSHSIPFVAACGIREIHLLAAWSIRMIRFIGYAELKVRC